jgi:D-alanyl-D-alanine dipeptidase/FMN phosphatase YigB (HAD superfamily)
MKFLKKLQTCTIVVVMLAVTIFFSSGKLSSFYDSFNLIGNNVYASGDYKYSVDSSDFVLLTDVIPDAILEIRYYSTYNFVGDRITGYEEPIALLTKEAAAALKQASDEFNSLGYRLKIYDAYRPQMAVTHFANWALDVNDTRMKAFFYPELDKSVLFEQGYIDAHSGHSRGSTLDLTLFDMNTEKEVDMGGTFDYFGELSHPDYTGITEQQYANRMLLQSVMVKHGFKPLPEEWWHFTLVDEPYPDTYFDFPVSRSSLLTNASDIEDQNNNKVKEQSDEGVLDPLSYWTTESAARTSLVSYVASVTDENSPDFIPVRDRIAVFDLDGTLFCETDPNYFDYCLLEYRVLDDPAYKDKASDFEKEVALKIRDQNLNHTSYKGLEVDHGKAVASAFAGMTIEEFNQYIQAFKAQPMPGYNNMTRGQSFYLPMVQVVNFLQAYDFTVYIVSGTDRFIVRGIIDNSILDIPPRQIIGSDETIKSNDQGDEDGLNYVFEDDDVLILGGEFIVKNLKMNKVSVIAQEIGQQPVLSFGNSTGDLSMCEYVVSNNKYKSMAFMLCCDDTVRENGNVEKADKMYALCDECDFVPISMKNDWTTIYGDNVTRK